MGVKKTPTWQSTSETSVGWPMLVVQAAVTAGWGDVQKRETDTKQSGCSRRLGRLSSCLPMHAIVRHARDTSKSEGWNPGSEYGYFDNLLPERSHLDLSSFGSLFKLTCARPVALSVRCHILTWPLVGTEPTAQIIWISELMGVK